MTSLSTAIARHSLRAYGYDVLVWVRFLSEACAKTVWQADRHDVLAYHRVRDAVSHLWGLTTRPLLLHLHSFLIHPTARRRCLNRRMAMAPGVSEWNSSIGDDGRWRLPDADRSHSLMRVAAPWPGWNSAAGRRLRSHSTFETISRTDRREISSNRSWPPVRRFAVHGVESGVGWGRGEQCL